MPSMSIPNTNSHFPHPPGPAWVRWALVCFISRVLSQSLSCPVVSWRPFLPLWTRPRMLSLLSSLQTQAAETPSMS
jgi:hypothetical protein